MMRGEKNVFIMLTHHVDSIPPSGNHLEDTKNTKVTVVPVSPLLCFTTFTFNKCFTTLV